MNYNNISQNTNFLGGSSKLDIIQYYLSAVNIPGMNFTIPEMGGRDSVKLNLGADTIQYNPLSFDLIIDEDFKVYHEFINKIKENISLNGGFANDDFDFWIQINNSKGNPLFKVEFSGCRIESISDIMLSTQDDTQLTLNISIKYDYYEIA